MSSEKLSGPNDPISYGKLKSQMRQAALERRKQIKANECASTSTKAPLLETLGKFACVECNHIFLLSELGREQKTSKVCKACYIKASERIKDTPNKFGKKPSSSRRASYKQSTKRYKSGKLAPFFYS